MKQDIADHTGWTLHSKVTSKQVAAQLKHPALQLPYYPINTQSPNPSELALLLLLVHISPPSPFPALEK